MTHNLQTRPFKTAYSERKDAYRQHGQRMVRDAIAAVRADRKAQAYNARFGVREPAFDRSSRKGA